MFKTRADDGTTKSLPARLPADRRDMFQAIYQQRLWGFERRAKFFSGVGSRGPAADAYVSAMVDQLSSDLGELGATAVLVDLGCGDFVVGRSLLQRLPQLTYVGCDIVPGLITHNHRAYASNGIRFRDLDMVTDELPDGDICLVRQVFQHLSNADISAVLPKLRKFRRVYVTEAHPTSPDGRINPDKPTGYDVRFNYLTGHGSGVELDRPPWNLRLVEICRTPRLVDGQEVLVTHRVFFPAADELQAVGK